MRPGNIADFALCDMKVLAWKLFTNFLSPIVSVLLLLCARMQLHFVSLLSRSSYMHCRALSASSCLDTLCSRSRTSTCERGICSCRRAIKSIVYGVNHGLLNPSKARPCLRGHAKTRQSPRHRHRAVHALAWTLDESIMGLHRRESCSPLPAGESLRA